MCVSVGRSVGRLVGVYTTELDAFHKVQKDIYIFIYIYISYIYMNRIYICTGVRVCVRVCVQVCVYVCVCAYDCA